MEKVIFNSSECRIWRLEYTTQTCRKYFLLEQTKPKIHKLIFYLFRIPLETLFQQQIATLGQSLCHFPEYRSLQLKIGFEDKITYWPLHWKTLRSWSLKIRVRVRDLGARNELCIILSKIWAKSTYVFSLFYFWMYIKLAETVKTSWN